MEQGLDFSEKDDEGFTIIYSGQEEENKPEIKAEPERQQILAELQIQPASPNSILRNRAVEPMRAVTLEPVSKKFTQSKKEPSSFWSIFFPVKKVAEINMSLQDTRVSISDGDKDDFLQSEAKKRDCCSRIKQIFCS